MLYHQCLLMKDETMTTETPTAHQIHVLRQEAAAHGDPEQVAICERALAGDAEAREECAQVIADAAAMDDKPMNNAWAPFLVLGIAGAIAAVDMMTRSTPQGSSNTLGEDPNLHRLTNQVIELLAHQGIPAGRLKCTAPCPHVGSWATKAEALQAERVAERVLMATGYKPQLAKINGQWGINIIRGLIAPSADRPLASR